MENIRFQYYSGQITDARPKGYVTLSQFITGVINPKPEIKQLLRRIKDAREAGDETRKTELKTHLQSFTPSVTVSQRRKIADITSFTGLMVLDFDKINYAAEFKEYLFNTYNWIMAAWLSASGRGVRGFVKIPVIDIAGRDPMVARLEYMDYFYGVAAELEKYIGFDEAPKNCVLPLFYSHDPDLLLRPDAKTWTDKGEIIKKQPIVTRPVYKIEPSDYWTKLIVKIIESGLNKIIDNGHTQLRALAYVVGGYVAGGYISESDAITEFHNRIPSHPYLKKGVEGYCKTASSAVIEGQKKPIIITDN